MKYLVLTLVAGAVALGASAALVNSNDTCSNEPAKLRPYELAVVNTAVETENAIESWPEESWPVAETESWPEDRYPEVATESWPEESWPVVTESWPEESWPVVETESWPAY